MDTTLTTTTTTAAAVVATVYEQQPTKLELRSVFFALVSRPIWDPTMNTYVNPRHWLSDLCPHEYAKKSKCNIKGDASMPVQHWLGANVLACPYKDISCTFLPWMCGVFVFFLFCFVAVAMFEAILFLQVLQLVVGVVRRLLLLLLLLLLSCSTPLYERYMVEQRATGVNGWRLSSMTLEPSPSFLQFL